jgi:hypothetical protein
VTEAWVLSAASTTGYEWYRVGDTLEPLEDRENDGLPPAWDVVAPALRPGRLCLAVASAEDQAIVALSDVRSARRRGGHPIRETFLFRDPAPRLGDVLLGACRLALWSDPAPGAESHALLRALSDAIGDPQEPHGPLTVDATAFALAISALATAATTEPPRDPVPPVPAGVWQDEPHARNWLADHISARADLPGAGNHLVYAVSFGAVPAALATAQVALTTHRDAASLPTGELRAATAAQPFQREEPRASNLPGGVRWTLSLLGSLRSLRRVLLSLPRRLDRQRRGRPGRTRGK